MKKLLFFFFALLLAGCSKDERALLKDICQYDSTVVVTDGVIIDPNNIPDGAKGTYYSAPYWDWENENFIMFKGNSIIVPWASGAPSAAIPLEVKNDFLRSNGWEMLYNTFPYAQADPIFILYNKLKGIARVYMWVTNTTYTASSFTWGYGVKTLNCQTASFNFNQINPLPYNSKLTNPSVYHLNYSSDGGVPNGINPNHWYYSDVELMYDPNMANLSHDNIEFCLHSFLTNKAYVKLTGSISGSIKGTFSIPASGGSGLLNDLVKGFDISKDGHIKFPTKAETTKLFNDAVSKQTNGVLKTLLSAALNEFSSNLSPTNFLLKTLKNAIISSSTTSSGKIECQVQAKTTTEGTITTVTAGPNISLLYPGTTLTSKGGLLPNYNKQLGVWHINNKPKIKNVQTYVRNGPIYTITNRMNIDLNSFNVVINPEVTQMCSNIVIKKHIVFSPDKDDYQITSAWLIDSKNNVMEYLSYYTNSLEYIYPYPRPKPMTEAFKVRIIIEMTPIGKTDPIIHIKDFEATII